MRYRPTNLLSPLTKCIWHILIISPLLSLSPFGPSRPDHALGAASRASAAYLDLLESIAERMAADYFSLLEARVLERVDGLVAARLSASQGLGQG